jgi:hypothetical protein
LKAPNGLGSTNRGLKTIDDVMYAEIFGDEGSDKKKAINTIVSNRLKERTADIPNNILADLRSVRSGK